MPFPRSLDQLVDHRVRGWQLDARRTQPRRRPCVALSRLPGSGADELGRSLSERLGYGFFDIELVDRIARDAGVQRELVAGMDEHVRSRFEALLDGLTNRHARFSQSAYLRRLVGVIAALGEGGSAVIVGRGSPYLLGPERALRVLVVAPPADRIERFAKRHDLALGEAETRLAREDAERRRFVERCFGVDPDDVSLYDLAVNTGSFGIAGCVDLVQGALVHRFPER